MAACRSSWSRPTATSPRPRCCAARTSPSPRTGGPSRSADSGLQAFQCRAQAGGSLFGLLATLALLLDDLLGRARDEGGVAELGVDPGDLVAEFLDLLLQPRTLGLEVDDLADRQCIRRLADHELQRSLRRGRRGLDALDARQPLDGSTVC